MKTTAWLIYRAHDASLRVNRQRPSLRWDEIGWKVTLDVPAPWGRLAGEVEITLPESPPSEIIVTEIAQPNGVSDGQPAH